MKERVWIGNTLGPRGGYRLDDKSLKHRGTRYAAQEPRQTRNLPIGHRYAATSAQ